MGSRLAAAAAAALLILGSAQAAELRTVPDPKGALKQIKPEPCVLAVGVMEKGADQVNERLICLADIVQNKDTIQERAGCGLVLYDLRAKAYRAGESNLTVAAATRTCAQGGSEELKPGPFLDYVAANERRAVVLSWKERRYRNWWDDLFDRKKDEVKKADALTERCTSRFTITRGQGKDWVYDRKAKIESGALKGITSHQYKDNGLECRIWRKQKGLPETSAPAAPPEKQR
ncbi:MAG: hypothetical protein IT285_12205 [Bdellovibrionales bacterium]|nr:hypothetical protein [Bdellovibrionales bacterium]